MPVPTVLDCTYLLFARWTRDNRSGTSRFFATYDASEAIGVKPAGVGMVMVLVDVVVEVVVEVVTIVVENSTVFVV